METRHAVVVVDVDVDLIVVVVDGGGGPAVGKKSEATHEKTVSKGIGHVLAAEEGMANGEARPPQSQNATWAYSSGKGGIQWTTLEAVLVVYRAGEGHSAPEGSGEVAGAEATPPRGNWGIGAATVEKLEIWCLWHHLAMWPRGRARL